MKKNEVKAFEEVTNSVNEAIECLMDTIGGALLVAVFSELLRELLEQDDESGALCIVNKIEELTDVEITSLLGPDTEDKKLILGWI